MAKLQSGGTRMGTDESVMSTVSGNFWIVNVGDLKPMEYPIQFFLDMAWRPEALSILIIYSNIP